MIVVVLTAEVLVLLVLVEAVFSTVATVELVRQGIELVLAVVLVAVVLVRIAHPDKGGLVVRATRKLVL